MLLAWLWPSLALGALTMLAVLSAGVDYAHPWQIPFAFAEFVVIGLPVGVVFGALVYGFVVLVWAVSRHRLSAVVQPVTYGVVTFVFSTVTLFGFLSLFPLAYSTIGFSLVAGLTFGCAFFVQCRRSASTSADIRRLDADAADDSEVYPTGYADGFEMRMFVSYGDCGDALVIAPDGREAGLIWETGDRWSFATRIEPDKGRWGTYSVTQPLPLTTDAEADAYLAALLPKLIPLWRDNPEAGTER